MNSPLPSQKRQRPDTPVSQRKTVDQEILKGNIRDAKIFFGQVLMSVDSLVEAYNDTVESEKIAELLDTELLSKLQQIRAELPKTQSQESFEYSTAVGDWKRQAFGTGRGKTKRRNLGKKRRS